MIADCLDEDLPFVTIRGNERHIQEVGCVADIVHILAQYEDGRVDLAVKGINQVQIIRIDRKRLYHRGIV